MSIASDTTACNAAFDEFYRAVTNETTWSGDAAHAYGSLNDVVSAEIGKHISNTYPSVIDLMSKDLPNLADRPAVKSAVEAAGPANTSRPKKKAIAAVTIPA